MHKLLVLADDLTGAIDTGVQVSALGIPVFVDLGGKDGIQPPEGTQALVVNTCTRHLPPQDAYLRVLDTAARALRGGVQAIYKKTDSGLRGNVGAELQAVMDAAGGKPLAFVPAYPKMGRTVSAGRLYVDGVPVSQSVFGRDLFTPVRHDHVVEIIAEQSPVPVISAADGIAPEKAVWLFDARNDHDMERAAATLAGHPDIRLFAGCAGFAGYLPGLIHMQRHTLPVPPACGRFLIVSGSVSEITLSQLARARERGYESITLEGDALYARDLLGTARGQALLRQALASLDRSERVLIDAAGSVSLVAKNMAIADSLGLKLEEARARVAQNLGALAGAALRNRTDVTLGVFGGDTLHEVLLSLHCGGIAPICEIEPGVVYSVCQLGSGRYVPLVSKSGNFGGEDLMDRMDRFLSAHGKEKTP